MYESKSPSLDSQQNTEPFMTKENFIDISDSEEAEDRNSSKIFLTKSFDKNMNDFSNNKMDENQERKENKNGKA
jgi:hypothetical protein